MPRVWRPCPACYKTFGQVLSGSLLEPEVEAERLAGAGEERTEWWRWGRVGPCVPAAPQEYPRREPGAYRAQRHRPRAQHAGSLRPLAPFPPAPWSWPTRVGWESRAAR